MRSLVVLFFIVMLGNAWAKNKSNCEEIEPINNQCLLILKGENFASIFPMENIIDGEIEWNNSRVHPEYSWSAEAGICKDNVFIGQGIEFALYSSNVHGFRSLKKGSIFDLVKSSDSKVSIYSTNSDIEERKNFDRNYGNALFDIRFLDNEFLMISSSDRRVAEKIFADKPTHARLIAKTPYPNYSYECYVEIFYE